MPLDARFRIPYGALPKRGHAGATMLKAIGYYESSQNQAAI